MCNALKELYLDKKFRYYALKYPGATGACFIFWTSAVL